jgi:hypothetical protein
MRNLTLLPGSVKPNVCSKVTENKRVTALTSRPLKQDSRLRRNWGQPLFSPSFLESAEILTAKKVTVPNFPILWNEDAVAEYNFWV